VQDNDRGESAESESIKSLRRFSLLTGDFNDDKGSWHTSIGAGSVMDDVCVMLEPATRSSAMRIKLTSLQLWTRPSPSHHFPTGVSTITGGPFFFHRFTIHFRPMRAQLLGNFGLTAPKPWPGGTHASVERNWKIGKLHARPTDLNFPLYSTVHCEFFARLGSDLVLNDRPKPSRTDCRMVLDQFGHEI
jgi:hypothetical protein